MLSSISTHAALGNIVWPAAPWFVLGASAAAVVGTEAMLGMPDELLKGALGVVMAALALRQVRIARRALRVL